MVIVFAGLQRQSSDPDLNPSLKVVVAVVAAYATTKSGKARTVGQRNSTTRICAQSEPPDPNNLLRGAIAVRSCNHKY